MACPTCTRTSYGTRSRTAGKWAELHLMQHSPESVNVPGLRCSVRRCRALGLPGPARAGDDLGLHRLHRSDATVLRLMPRRPVHHRCACCHRDASGSSRLHLLHHRRSQRAVASRTASARDPLGVCVIGSRHAPDLQTAALVAPAASPRPGGGRSCSRQCSRRTAHAPGLDLLHGRADPYP